MVCKLRDFAAAILMAAAAADTAFGQTTLGPPSAGYGGPQAVTATQVPAAGPTLGIPTPMAGVNGCASCQPGGHCNPFEDNNGPLLKGDPLLDDPAWGGLGWFAGAEADLVGTHIKNRLINQVTVGATTNIVHLPTAELDWTVGARIEIGYRFGEGAGELLVGYEFLNTSGNGAIAGFDAAGGTGSLHSDLSINAWDLDYGSREISLLPCWDLRWRAGVRLADVFFDSQAVSPLLEQRVSNYFVGAGPHVGLDLRRLYKSSGLQLFGRLDTAFMIGETTQSYEEVFSGPGAATGGATRLVNPLVTPWLRVEAGVGWTPPGFSQFTMSTGYMLEYWWDLADVNPSRGDIMSQGVFFRAEIRY